MAGSGVTTVGAGATLNAGSAGTLITTRTFGNLGTVNENSGVVQINNFASNTNSGTLNIAAGAPLSTNGSALTTAVSAGVITVAVILNLGGATLTNNGLVQPGGAATVATLTITGNY